MRLNITDMEHMCTRCARLFLHSTRRPARPLAKHQLRGFLSVTSRFAQGTSHLHSACAKALTVLTQAHLIYRRLYHPALTTKYLRKRPAKTQEQTSLHASVGSMGDHRNPEQLNLEERASELQDRLQASFFDEQSIGLLPQTSAR